MSRATWILALALAAAAPAAAEPRLSVELGGVAPYAFNEATVSSEGGLSGAVRVQALDLGGEAVDLFEARVNRARRLRVTFYVDRSMTALRFTGSDWKGAPLEATVPVSLGYGAAAGASENGDWSYLESLRFPLREAPATVAPLAFGFEAAEPYAIVMQAQRRLFAPSRSKAALIGLAAWSAAAMALAAFTRGGRGRLALAISAVAIACAVALVVAANKPAGDLYIVDLPAGGEAFTAVRDGRDEGDYAVSRWTSQAVGASGAPALSYIGVRSPLRPTVPVVEFSGFSAIRFKTPPVVTMDEDGKPALAAASYQGAWALGANEGEAR